jgi:hypothetical protein
MQPCTPIEIGVLECVQEGGGSVIITPLGSDDVIISGNSNATGSLIMKPDG